MNMIDLSVMSGWSLLVAFIIILAAWLLLRRYKKRSGIPDTLSSEYFKGLNYLLNDEQGKALDIFVKLVESDWEIIDTHFALGKIFRKNGEIDKAIKIHQGLIARPSLPEKYRSKVLLELGYDYLGAGWFDRAEGLFKEVLIHDKTSETARRNLILIYQQEKDWHKAIDIGVDLFGENPSDFGPMISQYYCELANIAKIKGDVSHVEHNAKQALRYDSGSVRASMLLAEQSMNRGDYKQAIRYIEQIEEQDAEFLPVVLDQLIECYHRLNDPDGLLEYLDDLEEKHDLLGLLEKHAMVIERYKDRDAVTEYLTKRLKKHPSIQGMHHLLAYKSNDASASDLTLFMDLKSALVKMKHGDTEFQCHHCGFQANTLYWLCPGCQSWGEIKPAIVEAA
jgi:lipopolysaccharide biosynthesis regulator YciM